MLALNTKNLTTGTINLSNEEVQINLHGKKALVTDGSREAWLGAYAGSIGTIVEVHVMDDDIKMMKLWFSNREKNGETLVEESFFEEELLVLE